MAARRVFFLSNSRLTVHHRVGGKPGPNATHPLSFDGEESGVAEFSLYLHRFPDAATCIIADVVEEEFREETIPHVPAWERRALLRARADRAFREAPHVHFTMLGRERRGRRDDRVLFSAITRPAVLAPWLAPMARCGVPLAGIWSPALLTGRLLKAIGATSENVLIVSLQSGGGLRQTWFRRRRLRLSRLAVTTDPSDGHIGAYIRAEIEHTRRYLDTLPETEDTNSVEVHVLGHGAMLDELRREQRRATGGDSGTGCTLVDLAGVARRLGLRSWGGEATADRLFVHALVERPPAGDYARPEETRVFITARARARLNSAAAALVAGGCVVAGATAFEGAIERGQARSLGLQATVYESRYRAAQAALPHAPAAAGDLDRAVVAANLLRERRADPVELLAMVGHALAEFPQVRVERIAWRTSRDPRSFDGAGESRFADGEHEPADPGRAGQVQHGHGRDLFQLALISARIEPFEGDYRAAIDTVYRLVDTLAVPAGVEHVRILDLPLDLGPGQTLSGDVETTADTAAFQILVALRVMSSEDGEV